MWVISGSEDRLDGFPSHGRSTPVSGRNAAPQRTFAYGPGALRRRRPGSHAPRTAIGCFVMHVPAVYAQSAFARDGGLLSYGVDRVDTLRRAASYVDRILRGVKPAELPVQMPIKFEMIVNLKTAKALGLAVPLSVLLRADAVIE